MPSRLFVVKTPQKLMQALDSWHSAGHSIGFVPTMGALHAGHRALVNAAKQQCDKVVVSIFINPIQFGAHEDSDRYPRTLKQDTALLQAAGVDLLFTPEAAMLYPPQFCTSVEVSGLSEVLCGAARPGHFSGVATIVTILLNLTRPDRVFFGEKDYQQLLIIKRLCDDLHLKGAVVPVPTLREPDGLALSSRNRYLTDAQRAIAPLLYACMLRLRDASADTPLLSLLAQETARLLESGFNRIDYFEIRDQETLALLEERTENARLFAAAWLGDTRLIDNLALQSSVAPPANVVIA